MDLKYPKDGSKMQLVKNLYIFAPSLNKGKDYNYGIHQKYSHHSPRRSR